MSHESLRVENLQMGVEDKVILDKLNPIVRNGETYVLMGSNGADRSTLGYTIMGHPQYSACQGNIVLDGDDIMNEPIDVRVRKGVSLSFQNPEKIPGIALGNFLRVSRGAVTGEAPHILKLQKEMRSLMDPLGISQDYAVRYLNVGLPGGEKKKSEILWTLMPNPKLVTPDETDFGLDVDAAKVVSKGIRQFRSDKNSLLITTHNAKILGGLKVDYVHTLVNDAIVRTGDSSLVQETDEKDSQLFKAGGVRS